MDKINRNYLLRVQEQSGLFIEIERPFTVEFSIERKYLAANAQSVIRVFNLSQNNRNQIRKDQMDLTNLREVSLKAGYGTNIPLVFTGNISQAWSVRQGVNFITEIVCEDRGFASVNGITNTTFKAGTPRQSIIEALVDSLKNLGISRGVIGRYPGALVRGNSYNGNTIEILNELTGGGFFIDNGKAYCLGDNEVYTGELETITSDSGLLGTPVRENNLLHVEMIFEPRLAIGQKIKLDSRELVAAEGDDPNAIYKVVSIKHTGMISETVCGEAITSAGLSSGTGAFEDIA